MYVTIATEEAIRAGILKIIAILFAGSAINNKQIEIIFKSFLHRILETATLLVTLGLEQSDVLDKKFQSGNIEDLVGLTLLYSAYISRHCSGLLLANQKILNINNCPEQSKILFVKIMQLKKSINEALNFANSNLPKITDKNARNLEEAHIVCHWIQLIKNGQLLTLKDKFHANQKEIDIINNIIAQIDQLKMLGMQILPQEEDNVVVTPKP